MVLSKLLKLPMYSTKLTLLVTLLSVSQLSFPTTAADQNQGKVHQLRIYEIPSHNAEVFHERFRDHAHRIMKKYGFSIQAMWQSIQDDKTEFIYLLSWASEMEMKEAWHAFMADEEWAAIKKRTAARYGVFVNSIEDRTLYLTPYSPKGTFNQ